MRYLLLFLLTTNIAVGQVNYNTLLEESIINMIEKNYPGYKTKYDKKPFYYTVLKMGLLKDTIKTYDEFKNRANLYISFFDEKHLYLVSHEQTIHEKDSFETQKKNKKYIGFEFRLIDKNTVYFKIPSFDILYKDVIDSIAKLNFNQIIKHKYLIIDVRGNRGGAFFCIFPIIKYFYSNQVCEFNFELFKTEENYNEYKQLGADTIMTKSFIINPMVKHRFSFKEEKLTSFKKPKYVAFIVDRNTASAAELLTLYAKGSVKTKIFGENTMGAVNYGNIVKKCVIKEKLYLAMPIMTNLALHNNDIDACGITPDFYLDNSKDYIPQVMDIIKRWK